MSEEKLLKYYGCNSLSEFIDTYLDCETAFDLLRSQFKEIERLKKELEIEKDISDGMLETIDEAIEYIEKHTKEGIIKDKKYFYSPEQAQDILEILKKEENNESRSMERY